ncbi:hypothetical protein F5879DRAFT_812591 [Lentinula edodes]|nr:hypothetical protein F5879DRAFT_812591 [Lentinula edodes]
MVMHMKGHNGVCPCRMCNIRGIWAPDGKVYYVPLDHSHNPDLLSALVYDPSNLPQRTHAEMKQQAKEVQFAPNSSQSEKLAMKYGIKGTSALMALSSLSFPLFFPYDFMHLLFKNILKLLVLWWIGAFKDLDEGSGSFQLDAKIWEAIGTATSASGSTIPSASAACPPNVADDKQATTTDSWSFWLLYLGPILLQNKFRSSVYHHHFCDLASIVERCLQFEIE